MGADISRQFVSDFCLFMAMGILIVTALVNLPTSTVANERSFDFDAFMRKTDRQFRILMTLEVLTFLAALALFFKSLHRG